MLGTRNKARTLLGEYNRSVNFTWTGDWFQKHFKVIVKQFDDQWLVWPPQCDIRLHLSKSCAVVLPARKLMCLLIAVHLKNVTVLLVKQRLCLCHITKNKYKKYCYQESNHGNFDCAVENGKMSLV